MRIVFSFGKRLLIIFLFLLLVFFFCLTIEKEKGIMLNNEGERFAFISKYGNFKEPLPTVKEITIPIEDENFQSYCNNLQLYDDIKKHYLKKADVYIYKTEESEIHLLLIDNKLIGVYKRGIEN